MHGLNRKFANRKVPESSRIIEYLESMFIADLIFRIQI
jgi:hypothetical protein